MKKSVVVFCLGIFALSLVSGVTAAGPQKEMVTRVVKVRYIETNSALRILQKYVRGPNESISQLPGQNQLVIEASRETAEKILSILEEIDVKPIDLEFHVDVLLGSTEAPGKEDASGDLKSDPVVKELSSLMKYKYFRRLDSAVIRVQDGAYSQQRLGGSLRQQGPLQLSVDLRLNLRPRYVKEEKGGLFMVALGLYQLHGFGQEGKERTSTLINTTLSLESGKRTVVGVSKLDGGDNALILVISGRVI